MTFILQTCKVFNEKDSSHKKKSVIYISSWYSEDFRLGVKKKLGVKQNENLTGSEICVLSPKGKKKKNNNTKNPTLNQTKETNVSWLPSAIISINVDIDCHLLGAALKEWLLGTANSTSNSITYRSQKELQFSTIAYLCICYYRFVSK